MFQPATMGKQQASQRRTKKSVMKAPKDFTDPAAAPKGHAAKQRKWTMLGLHRLRAPKVFGLNFKFMTRIQILWAASDLESFISFWVTWGVQTHHHL